MARSRKKNPAGGITVAASDKADKVLAHRRTRRAGASALRAGADVAPDPRQTENPYSYAKDGKRWFGAGKPELLRK
jgi:hypothetical protein